jgi:alkylation response protein AidB-like acyl-CoA dehydrogenase
MSRAAALWKDNADVAEACLRHASASVQIHGGSGFIRGYEAERLFRDAHVLRQEGAVARRLADEAGWV